MTEPDLWLPKEFNPGLVSVIIPTFNREALLNETLQSVFEQDYHPIEIIVADDGSTDGTLAMLNRQAPPRGVTLHVSAGEHGGAAVARNRGAQLSRGEYVMFLDSDDLLEPRALATLIDTLGDADLAVGAWRDLRDGQLSGPVVREFGPDWLVDLLRNEWFATCATLHRRAALCRADAWNPQAQRDDDFFFVAMLALSGAKLADTSESVARYRDHSGSQLSQGDVVAKTHDTELVLKCIEQELDRRDAWTPARREALAFRWFFTARMVWFYGSDTDRFADLVQQALRVQPDFKPPKSWYKWIADLAGYKNAERVAAIGRRLFR